ncbi:hydroxyethylthiazole kinase [Clostridium sp.]|uniref:hydroxyethylthiazole kinase n=1 Tax=Clostridium sp. TaxID=1506 RepID=UPI003216A9E6
MIKDILDIAKKTNPLVHNITNYVVANDCANITLACGGSPIMADDPEEVEEITTLSNALVMNLGTLNPRILEAMIKAGRRANKLKHPIILDPVGVGASSFRQQALKELLNTVDFQIIKGNISEIKTIGNKKTICKGVDASEIETITEYNIEGAIGLATQLSTDLGAIIAITGAIDIVADKDLVYIIRNGHPSMRNITGTGCMLSSIIGVLVGANPDKLLDATVTALGIMGVCGELAYSKIVEKSQGNGSLKIHLIDCISNVDYKILENKIKIEKKF